jgi:hypothetical protein
VRNQGAGTTVARLLNAGATRWCVVSDTYSYESKANNRAREDHAWRHEWADEMIADEEGRPICTCTHAEPCDWNTFDANGLAIARVSLEQITSTLHP